MANAPTMTAGTELPRPTRHLRAAFLAFFNDPAIIYAIKFGVAGVLAVFLALVIKLQDPTWALFTVYVLMIAQYVGAIAEKSFFRIVGTVVGGLLGYLLTASLEQSPITFLLLTGVIVGVATMLFGQSRYPYAFLLCGLTTVVVVSNGLANPDQSWQFMLWRTEEVCVGIVATVLVQSVIFPRYARDEFTKNTRSAFADLRDCFAASARILLHGGNNEATFRAESFPARITNLRTLLEFGGRESQHFRDRQATYFALTSCLSNIAAAIVTLGQTLSEKSLYRPAITEAITTLHEKMVVSLDDLSIKDISTETRTAHREDLEKAFAALEAQLTEFRGTPEIFSIAPEEAMVLGLHMLAIEDIREQIHRAHELIDSLPEDLGPRIRDAEPFVSPFPPSFWIKSGIKSGIAIVLALLLYNWFNPPGGTMFVLGAWVFTAMNATSPSGQGDRRTFHCAVYDIAALIVLSLLLILGSPMLSSYAVMNTLIFTWLFVWGYLSYTIRGMNIPMQFGMLTSVGILGLNGQRPIDFQAIAGLFIGLALAQVLASVLQRVLWPSLPQWEMRNRFVEFTDTCIKLIKVGPKAMPMWQKVRLALIPGEVVQRITILENPGLPDGEAQRLRDYLFSLQKVGNHLVATVGKLVPLLPSFEAKRGPELIAQMENEMVRHLQAHEKSMKETAPLDLDTAPLAALLETWQDWLKEMRLQMIKEKFPVIAGVQVSGFCGRYEQIGHQLLQAGKQARELRMPLYMGDYIL